MEIVLNEWAILGLVLAAIYVWRLVDLGINFIKNARGEKVKKALGAFVILWGLGEAFLLASDRILRYTHSPPVVIFESASYYPVQYVFASMAAYLGLAIVIYYATSAIWKSYFRYFPAAITCLPFIVGPFVLFGIFDLQVLRYADYIAAAGAIIFPLEYIYIGIKLGGELRKKSMYISSGVVALFIGKALCSNIVTVPIYNAYGITALEMFITLPPIVIMIGTFLIEAGYEI